MTGQILWQDCRVGVAYKKYKHKKSNYHINLLSINMTNAECSAVDQSLHSILVNSGVVEVMDEGVHLCL